MHAENQNLKMQNEKLIKLKQKLKKHKKYNLVNSGATWSYLALGTKETRSHRTKMNCKNQEMNLLHPHIRITLI